MISRKLARSRTFAPSYRKYRKQWKDPGGPCNESNASRTSIHRREFDRLAGPVQRIPFSGIWKLPRLWNGNGTCYPRNAIGFWHNIFPFSSMLKPKLAPSIFSSIVITLPGAWAKNVLNSDGEDQIIAGCTTPNWISAQYAGTCKTFPFCSPSRNLNQLVLHMTKAFQWLFTVGNRSHNQKRSDILLIWSGLSKISLKWRTARRPSSGFSVKWSNRCSILCRAKLFGRSEMDQDDLILFGVVKQIQKHLYGRVSSHCNDQQSKRTLYIAGMAFPSWA